MHPTYSVRLVLTSPYRRPRYRWLVLSPPPRPRIVARFRQLREAEAVANTLSRLYRSTLT
jgi:hypothetical protein